MELCFADFQTTVFAFQAIAIHPGDSTEFLVCFGELPVQVMSLDGAGAEGEWGSQPSTGLFSMHRGCHAAGGAAVVFILVHQNHESCRKGPSQEVWRAAHGPLWSVNFSTQSSSCTAILLHHIAACWTSSIQSMSVCERRRVCLWPPRLQHSPNLFFLSRSPEVSSRPDLTPGSVWHTQRWG